MKRFIETMVKCQKAIGAALLASCLVFISIHIFSGYVGTEVLWAGKMSVYAMIWGVFVESGALVYDKSHFVFTGFSGRIQNERTAALWDICLSAVKMVFSLLLIYYGFKLSSDLKIDAKAEFLIRGHIWLCLPVCGFTSLIYLLYHAACDAACLRKGGNRP